MFLLFCLFHELVFTRRRLFAIVWGATATSDTNEINRTEYQCCIFRFDRWLLLLTGCRNRRSRTNEIRTRFSYSDWKKNVCPIRQVGKSWLTFSFKLFLQTYTKHACPWCFSETGEQFVSESVRRMGVLGRNVTEYDCVRAVSELRGGIRPAK